MVERTAMILASATGCANSRRPRRCSARLWRPARRAKNASCNSAQRSRPSPGLAHMDVSQ